MPEGDFIEFYQKALTEDRIRVVPRNRFRPLCVGIHTRDFFVLPEDGIEQKDNSLYYDQTVTKHPFLVNYGNTKNRFTWMFRKRGCTQVQKQHLVLYEPCSGVQGST